MANSKRMEKFAERVFALDLRSLAVFRIGLGLLIISDLIHRWPAIFDMFTGDGFFTHELSFQFYDRNHPEYWHQALWSVYWLSDSVEFVYALHGIAFIFAVLLLLGKWTKVATIASWILLASLHVRNPMVTSSGDFLFKMMLFWSVFLPLEAKWSLDARRRKEDNNSITSVASAAYMFQVFAIYFFSGLAKWNSVWLNGDAMDFVLRLNIYARDFGVALLDYPELLTWTTWATLFAELLMVWTIFLYWNNGLWRLLNIAVFWLFHLGIAVSLAIGLFPWICIVAWLPLIPTCIWQKSDEPLKIINRFNWQSLSTPKLAIEMFCSFALLVVIVWNIGDIDHPVAKSFRSPAVYQIGSLMAVDQQFKMFGEPPSENPWFVYEGQLAKGKVDLWRQTEIAFQRPISGLNALPRFHWRKFHRNAIDNFGQFARQPMLEYAVKKWNQTHPTQNVLRARLICFTEPIGPDYQEKSHTSHVWAQYSSNNNRPGSLFDSFLLEDDDLSL